MPTGIPTPKDVKDKILYSIKFEGKLAAEAAREYGISPNLVYRWLKSSTEVNPSQLTINRLEREKQELLEVIGKLTVSLDKRGKKGSGRHN